MAADAISTATITCQIDTLPGGKVGLGVYTEGPGNKAVSPEAAETVDALLTTLQNFCDVNEFPVNVRRRAQ